MHDIVAHRIASCHLRHVPHSCVVLQASDLLNHSDDDPDLIDPRELVNWYGLTAAQLAAHSPHSGLARMLLPGLCVLQLLEPEDIDRLVRCAPQVVVCCKGGPLAVHHPPWVGLCCWQ